ncbi:MAG: fused MFS/spermidine synthase [Nitrospinaceae bacterium]
MFFLASGATGLIYEVVWTRLLTLVLGNTHYSVATVLTTFMAGLALGSFLGGRWIDRRGDPLRVYAWLEGAIGLYCLAIPFFIDGALPVFRWIYSHFQEDYWLLSLLRFMVCAAILIVPTTLMGATLPVLGKFLTRNTGQMGQEVGTLYAVNTFGAVAGALASAFVLLRFFGVSATIHAAAALNLCIAGALGLGIGKGYFPAAPAGPPEAPVETKKEEPLSAGELFLLLAFGLSGLAALIYQVAWNRIFSLVLGSSVYAFSLILTTFILGLAVGTLVFSRVCKRLHQPQRVFALLQVGIGLTALAAIPLFGSIPLFNRWVFTNWGQDFLTIQGSNFLVISALIFSPTFFMGAQFPVVVRLLARGWDTVGRRVGLVYAANTVGTILGSFAAGFLLIPVLGIQKTLLAAVLVNVGVGLALLAWSPGWGMQVRALGIAGVMLLTLWAAKKVPPWDRAVISSGSFMPYRIEDLDQALQGRNKILFYKEGIHTTVTTELAVTGNIFLRVNGKTDASLAGDMRTQLLSGYLPMLFHAAPKDVLVVGQGSGITLGAVERFDARSIDLVEISPAVIEGSRYFDPFNHHSLDDPRVQVVLEDGRNHLTLTNKTYDVIISEPSNPWISGVGALFTRDFYRLLARRLNPGGIACVWIHTNMSPDSFKSIIRAYMEGFSHVTMWESIVGDDYLLIGANEPLALAYEKTRALLDRPQPGRELRRLGISSVRDLMGLLIMDEGGLRRFSQGAPVHTDDNSLLEFSAPEYIYKDERDVIVRELTPYFEARPQLITFAATDAKEQTRVLAEVASLERTESQVRGIKQQARIDQRLEEARSLFEQGAYARTLQLYQEILRLDPDHVLAYYNLGNVYRTLKQSAKAERAYLKTLEINPYYAFGALAVARFHLATGRPGLAVDILKKTSAWLPEDAETRTVLGLALNLDKKPQAALRQWRLAVRLDPGYLEAHYFLGIAQAAKAPAKARNHLETYLGLAAARGEKGPQVEKARQLLMRL